MIQRYLVRMLTEGRGRELERIKHVALLATPNAGSLLALDARRVLLGRNLQEHQLRPLNQQVADTLRALVRDVVNAQGVSERTCPIPFSVFAGEEDGVVPPASAQAVFPDVAALPGDHFSIARPDSTEHRSYTAIKRLLLVAAAEAGTPIVPASGRLTTVVSAHEEQHDDAVHYRARRTDNGLFIQPADPYLARLRACGDVSHRGPVEAPLPFLDVKVVNNTRRTAFIHSARLLVTYSRQSRPIPFRGYIALSLSTGELMSRPVWNCGGPMDDCTLTFHLEHPNSPDPLTGDHVLDLASDGEVLDYRPVLESLADAGIANIPHQPSRARCRYRDFSRLERERLLMLPLSVFRLVGTLRYSSTQSDGTRRSVTHQTWAPVYLVRGGLESLGAYIPPSHVYSDPILRTEGNNYESTVTLSQALQPGESDRFLILLRPQNPDRPSTHDFRLSLLYESDGAGELDCGRITVELLKPPLPELPKIAEYRGFIVPDDII